MYTMRLRQPTDFEILEILERENNASPLFIAEIIGKTNEYVRQEIISLKERGLIEKKSHGLYSITDRGRRAIKYRKLNGTDKFETLVAEGSSKNIIQIGKVEIEV